MTLIYDIATGALLGQEAQGAPAGYVRVFSRDGYRDVPADAVRLEVLR